MKRIKNLTFAMIVLLLTLNSCGSSKIQEIEVSPLKTKIKGDIGNYLEVSDEKYKVVKSQEYGQDWEITFKLKNIKKGFIGKDDYKIDFKLVLTDNTGKPISGIEAFWMADGLWNNETAREKLRELIKNDEGTEEWFTLTVDVSYGSEFEETLPEGITNFTINTIVEKKIVSKPNNTNTTNDSGSKKWDVILEDLDEYVVLMIAQIKKYKEGDLSAMQKAGEIDKKATALFKKLENANNDLSSSQLQRFSKIQLKLANAALEMQK